MLNLIFCVDSSGLFGRQNQLPWNFKEDLKYFRDITTNFNRINNDENVIVMGYNTWLSIKKKLPNRKNVVISSKKFLIDNHIKTELHPDYIFKSFDIFIENCKKNKLFYNKNIFVIGGKKLLSYVIVKYNKFIKHVFMNIIQHSFPQFIDDVLLRIYSFSNFEINRLCHNSIYSLNTLDGKYYYIKFNQYINKNFNMNEVLKFTDGENNTLISYKHENNENNQNNHYQYTILEEIQDVPLNYCNDCQTIVKEPVSKSKKCIIICNDCLKNKCKCLFC